MTIMIKITVQLISLIYLYYLQQPNKTSFLVPLDCISSLFLSSDKTHNYHTIMKNTTDRLTSWQPKNSVITKVKFVSTYKISGH